MTEAAEEIRAAADPEANIIFGTSFNERLGEEVMITVIATGFDGRRRPAADRAQQPERVPAGAVRTAPAAAGAAGAGATVPARDFLEELERQRTEVDPDGLDANGQTAAAVPSRSVGEPAPAKRPASYDADDLEIPSFLRRR